MITNREAKRKDKWLHGLQLHWCGPIGQTFYCPSKCVLSKGSLSCSQEPTIGLYPEPYGSSQHPIILFLEDLL
jgi:hypothetical protein